MLSMLDPYVGLVLTIGGVCYRFFSQNPDPEASVILALLVVFALSTSAQCLFGLDLRPGIERYRVLPLSRRGWVPGSDSLVSSLLTETGLFNAAGDLGVGTGGFASLEAIVSLRPDFLLVSETGNGAEDEGRAFLLHPALERFYPPAKRIVIPERLTVCGGVMLAEALDVLVKELERVGR